MAALTTLALTASTVLAAEKYSDGAITWDTSSAVWSLTSAGTYDQLWANGDDAIFEGAAGTVTLGEAITAAKMTFTTDGYTVDANGNTLTLSSGGTITADANNITIDAGLGGGNLAWTMDGTGSATLTGDKDGGNFTKDGSGTWTLEGLVDGRVCNINAGHLVVTGTLSDSYRYIRINSGATLHYNSSGAIDSRSGTSTSWRWQLQGGALLDNTSGAAITTSDHDPSQWWNGDWTFLGSNGANSDLYLGTGEVGLTGSRTITVSNALTTLSVGGVIADYGNNYGVTKDGPGTLVLSAVNTYTGTTTVSAGTLSLGDGTDNSNLADTSVLEIATGAELDANWSAGNVDDVFLLTFDGVPQVAGTWGSLASSATNKDARITGTGVINNQGGVYTDGTFFWDGVNTGGTGDGASDGGLGTWSTSTDNWDRGLVAREVWTNDTGNKAIFSGPSGDVTLGTDITLGELIFESAAAAGYLITGNTLNFGGANDITTESDATIASAITGSPTVDVISNTLTLAPTGGSMTIGTINPVGNVRLGGTTTGNTAAELTKQNNNVNINKDDTGTWTVTGDLYFGNLDINGGELIVTGKLYTVYRDLSINNGGTVVINGTFDPRDNDPVNFNSGGTMKGTGELIGPMTAGPMNVKSGAILAPGDPTGTLTMTNADCLINGTLAITVDGAACSTLAIVGDLDLSSGTDIIEVTELGAATLGTYTVATYTGSLTGTFDTETLPGGYAVDYGTPGEIRLTVGGGGGTPFETWATGGELWGDDANGDGVQNGMAFLLGAADPNADATGLLPVSSEDGSGGLVLTFSMLNAATRGAATMDVQHSGDLGDTDAWVDALVPEVTGGPVNGVSFVVTPNGTKNDVVATISSSEAVGGKLFGRLQGTE